MLARKVLWNHLRTDICLLVGQSFDLVKGLLQCPVYYQRTDGLSYFFFPNSVIYGTSPFQSVTVISKKLYNLFIEHISGQKWQSHMCGAFFKLRFWERYIEICSRLFAG